jgi:hypothetical protein
MMVVSPDAFALHSYMGGRRKGIKIKSNLHLVVLKSQLIYTYISKKWLTQTNEKELAHSKF